MEDVQFKYPLGTKAVNLAALTESLRAAGGAAFCGVSQGGTGELVALFTDTPAAEQLAAVDGVFDAHDAAALTPEQAAEVTRQQAETAARPVAVQALGAYNAAMADLTDNWAGLTAGARLEAVRVGVIVALRLVRWLVARTLG